MYGSVIGAISDIISHSVLGDGGIAVAIASAAFAAATVIAVSAFVYFYGWAERKVIAKSQYRHGPNVVGKYGLLQNLADMLKMLSKGVVVPRSANRYLFLASIPVMLFLFLFLILLLPVTGTLYGVDISLGMLVVFVLLSFLPLVVFVAGWSSGNKFASIGAQRSVAMLIGYEIPMVITMAAVALGARSYNLISIVSAQSTLPFALVMPLGLIVFSVGMLAETERPPFDIREADSELIAGWLIDVSPPYYSLALFIDYARVLFGSMLISIMFFGGWNGPVLPPFAWMAVKVLLISFIIILIRVSTVRMRISRLIDFGWSYLLPLSIINLIWVAFLTGVI
jgi:NADH-quinone oxidoreductase subunit H